MLDRSEYGVIRQIDINASGTLCAYTLPIGLRRSILRVIDLDTGRVRAQTDPKLADFCPHFISELHIAFLSVNLDAAYNSDFRTSVQSWDLSEGGRSASICRLYGASETFTGITSIASELCAHARAPTARIEPGLEGPRPLWKVYGETVIPLGPAALLILAGAHIYLVTFAKNNSLEISLLTDLTRLQVKVDRRKLGRVALNDTCRFAARHTPKGDRANCNWKHLQALYEPLVARATTTREVILLLNEVLGKLCMSHAYAKCPSAGAKRQGLLGVSTRFDDERGSRIVTRVPRIDPRLSIPMGLADPLLGVRAGDIIVAINNIKLTLSRCFAELLSGKAGQKILCRLRSTTDHERGVEIEALADDRELEYAAWVWERESIVARLTANQTGYIHLPDASTKTAVNLERYLACQDQLAQLIVDLRYNEGGPYGVEIAELLARKPAAFIHTQWLRRCALPVGSATRFLAVLVNRFTSSGGEVIAELLRRGAGATIIGEQTFGAGVGQTLGRNLTGRMALWLPEIEFEAPPELAFIENRGVLPDIEVSWSREWSHRADGLLIKAISTIRRKGVRC